METKEVKAGGASDFVRRLMEKGLVTKQDITDDQYSATFKGTRPRGEWLKVVVLHSNGLARLQAVNATVEKLFVEELMAAGPSLWVRPALAAFNRAAPTLVKHLQRRRFD
jgi:hypothetical protein